MQVIQTINDTIRILFSPLEEEFRLLDFLLVQEGENKYLAQIIEIYDDKYDASQNVARVKLFFKVNSEGEIFNYDHFTPSKECEIKKINRDEILNFINDGKEALTIGLDYQSEEPFDINLKFLENNPVIFADKIEHANTLSAQFARTLSRYCKHSVVFDFSGTLEIQNAKRLTITKDIKLPLDFYTIDYIWEKGLSTASLETQAICREIFNEVQTFAKTTPEGYIPFNKFLKVVQTQYNATPIVELTVLLNKLKSYQKNNIFAKAKKDFALIQKTVEANEITIIDFSELKTEWHKEFCKFIIRNIKDAFVFLRLNETNSDTDLICFLYDKNPQIKLVSSIPYTYSKMPHIIEHANNFILLPTLNPRRDFGAANFELASISPDECILFGKDTQNFIFTIKNNKFEKERQQKEIQKSIKLKFSAAALKNARQMRNEKAALDNDFEKNGILQNEKHAQNQVITEEELEFFEQFTPMNDIQGEAYRQEAEEPTPVKKSDDRNADEHYDLQNEENLQDGQPEEENAELAYTQEEQIIDTSEEIEQDDELSVEEFLEQTDSDSDTENEISNNSLENAQNDRGFYIETVEPDETDYEITEDLNEPPLEEISLEDKNEEELISQETFIEETISENPEAEDVQESSDEEDEEPFVKIDGREQSIDVAENANEITIEQTDITDFIDEEPNEIQIKPQEELYEQTQEETAAEPAREALQGDFQNILVQEETEETEEEKASEEPFSLEAIAAQSIEATFNEVMEKDDINSPNSFVVDDNVVIDLEKIKEDINTDTNSELPIFKNKPQKKDKPDFKSGDKVEHDKYGRGEIVKVITYANRSLLQIDFEEVGKRLLDPDIANIKIV